MIADLCCLPYCLSREKLNTNGERGGDTLSMEPPKTQRPLWKMGRKELEKSVD